jgi:hypothetical protein
MTGGLASLFKKEKKKIETFNIKETLTKGIKYRLASM